MISEIKDYLEEVRAHLHLDASIERRVLQEFYDHIQDRVAELRREGLPLDKATRLALESFGRARVVARLMYEAHSKGSWTDAAIAALPHLAVALLFITNSWQNPSLGFATFSFILGITLFAWWKGKPNWMYSWVGYAFLPLMVVAYLVWPDAQAGGWSLALVVLYYLLFALLLVMTTIRVVKRDWILTSLMLAPLPIIGCWLFNVEQSGNLFQYSAALNQWSQPIALVCIVLGLTAGVFTRLRTRVLKVAALMATSSVALAMMAHNLWGNVGLFGMLGFSMAMLVILLAPALLNMVIGNAGVEKDSWLAEADNITAS